MDAIAPQIGWFSRKMRPMRHGVSASLIVAGSFSETNKSESSPRIDFALHSVDGPQHARPRPGVIYIIQVRALGSSTNYSDRSDPVQHMAM